MGSGAGVMEILACTAGGGVFGMTRKVSSLDSGSSMGPLSTLGSG
jgi:hypothetical protein